MFHRSKLLFVLLSASLLSTRAMELTRADDRVFSGPQVGEKLPPLKIRGVFEPHAGKELDLVATAAGKPIVLVFIHDVNRPSLRMTKLLTSYTAGLASRGVATGVVWLTDDVTEAETLVNKLGRMPNSADRALSRAVPTGVSLDGREGPGSYGLNRNVTLTILVGQAGKVTANFALIQSSIAVDLPKILPEIAKVCGAPAASLDDLLFVSPNSFLDQMLSLTDRSATPEDVDQAAVAIDRLLKDDGAARDELRRVLRNATDKRIVDQHGTARAREHLRRWSQQLSPAQEIPRSGQP